MNNWNDWRVYIGTKIVQACPCGYHNFLLYKKQIIDPKRDSDIPGYLVRYRDGYTSWCPTEEFELANRELTLSEKDLILG